VEIIGSDHSPAPLSMKCDEDFFNVWGGIAGVQSTLAVLLTAPEPPQLPLSRIAALTAANPAQRFRIANKGQIRVGFDADFTLVDLTATYTHTRESLLSRHGLSPYLGASFRGVVRRTVLRGHTIFVDGKMTGALRGRMVTHAKTRIHA